MSVISLRISLSVVAIAALCAPAYAEEAGASEPTLVELWSGGDDGLTQKLTVALRNAFDSSPDFVRRHPGKLKVLIPTHVKWEDVGKQTKVIYTVEFSAVGGEKISIVKGWCWDGEYEKCTAKIMKAARKAARKIREDEKKSK